MLARFKCLDFDERLKKDFAVPLIFPGMDPYLENPAIFPGIHGPMVTYLRDQIAPRIRPRYAASVGERVYVESASGWQDHAIIPDVWVRHTKGRSDQDGGVAVAELPEVDEPIVMEAQDLEIRQPFIEILDRESNMRVVTVIELISPSNKYAGPGRDSYVTKQREVYFSDTHLVEIDLLRRGPHVVAIAESSTAARYDYDYLVCVHRAHTTRFEVYPRSIRQKLPCIRIPLAGNDPDVGLDIRAALEQAYEAGSYEQRIDYSQPCQPPLADDVQAWVNQLVEQAKRSPVG